MAVLWSEFLALWFDRTRRRALPLLLATLLLLIPSLPARSDCSCEMPGEHHHEMASCNDGDDHENGEVHEHQHPVQAQVRTGHGQLLTGNHMTVSRAEMACCSCSRFA